MITAPPFTWMRLCQSQLIARFAVVGIAGNVVNLVTFSMFIGLHASPLIAACLAFLIANAGGYLLHREWTFGHLAHRSGVGQGSKFLLVSLLSLVISLLFLHLFHHLLPVILAQFCALQAASVCNLLGNRYWTFSPQPV